MNNKTDNITDLFAEYQLNLLFLTETWHIDSDSVALKRSHGMGLNVIEAARELPHTTGGNVSYGTNHGGLAIVSKHGVNLAKIDTKLKLKSFENLCCRVCGRHTPLIMVNIYRPGSQRVCDQFFKDLSTLLESLATYNI